MNGVWIQYVRFNGGGLDAAILDAGPGCYLQVEPLHRTIILPGRPNNELVGMKMLLQNAAFTPEDGWMECWGPNNAGGILDPVNPWGYVSLPCMVWEPVSTDEIQGDGMQASPVNNGDPGQLLVAGAYTGTQARTDVDDLKRQNPYALNGSCVVPDLLSPAEIAQRDLAAHNAETEPPPPMDEE